MSEDIKRRLEKANRKIIEKTEIIRLSRLSLRSALGFGIPIRDRLMEKQGQFLGQLQQGRQQNQSIPSPPSGQKPMPQVAERFANRPRLLDFLQQSQEPQQPELNPEEAMILDEHRKQMMEDAEARAKNEADEREADEKRKASQRAHEKMSIENL